MKNIVFKCFIALVFLVVSASTYAQGLFPEHCNIEKKSLYFPLSSVDFSFNCNISIIENGIAEIYLGDEVVASTNITAVNREEENWMSGTAKISFNPALILPKGHTYKLVIQKGIIQKKDDSATTNDLLTADIIVPEYLGINGPTIQEGSIVEEINRIGFGLETEADKLENAEFILMREGIPVRTYTCQISCWETETGQAWAEFGSKMKFEEGVSYSLKLPKDMVCALYRPDITNEEAVVNFIGGYKGSFNQLNPTSYSLFDNGDTDVFNSIRFFYDQSIMLPESAVIQLYEDGVLVKEVAPTLTSEPNRWIVTANFDGYTMIQHKLYSIVIPEATVINTTGDIIVNKRNEIMIGSATAIDTPDASHYTVKFDNGGMRIDNAAIGSSVKIHASDGKLLYNSIINSASEHIAVLKSDMYVVVIDGMVHKIMLEK